MIQRVQSLYLGATCIVIVAFIKAPIWVKVNLNHILTIQSYALITSMDGYFVFPYGLSALLASYLILASIYTIIRHDNRNLQLRLINVMNLTLVILMILILVLIKKANTAYLPTGDSSYKIGILLPCIALTANLLAQYHIKKDEQLVNADRLR